MKENVSGCFFSEHSVYWILNLAIVTKWRTVEGHGWSRALYKC